MGQFRGKPRTIRQYVAVRFNHGAKAYTYHNDGPTVRIGDQVKIADWRGDGWQRALVVDLVRKPEFATKPILGKIPVDLEERAAMTQLESQGSLFGDAN